MDRLKGKVAIIAGAGSSGPGWGNGKATAVLFAREGANVVALDLNDAAAAETVQIISGEGGNAVGFHADVTNPGDCLRSVEAAKSAFGGLHILINNVGIVEVGGVVDLPFASWQMLMSVNLTSHYLMCKAAVPAMIQGGGGGSIVNVSSVAAIRHMGVHLSAYAASKAGILGLTNSVALEFAGHHVRCNAILPGLMNTPMIVEPLKEVYAHGDVDQMISIRNSQCPMGCMGDAWDVAYAALFLASDESRYITATSLIVDGGLTAKC